MRDLDSLVATAAVGVAMVHLAGKVRGDEMHDLDLLIATAAVGVAMVHSAR